MQTFIDLNISLSEPTAVAVGYFDGVHTGHRAVISSCLSQKEKGLKSCVFSFDMSSSAPMGKANTLQLQSFHQKEQALANLGVDFLVCPPFKSFMSMSPEEYAIEILVNRFNAKVVCCGYDYRFGKGAVGDKDSLKALLFPYNVEVIAVGAVLDGGLPVSSTRIRSALAHGKIQDANKLLGYPFSIKAPVAHGRHLGSTLGFPTANQPIEEGLISPAFGVYATEVIVDDVMYPAVTNIGVKPTITTDGTVIAESFIIGFNGDIYGKTITTEFLHFIRAEEKFASIDLLKASIRRDAETAVNLLSQTQ